MQRQAHVHEAGRVEVPLLQAADRGRLSEHRRDHRLSRRRPGPARHQHRLGPSGLLLHRRPADGGGRAQPEDGCEDREGNHERRAGLRRTIGAHFRCDGFNADRAERRLGDVRRPAETPGMGDGDGAPRRHVRAEGGNVNLPEDDVRGHPRRARLLPGTPGRDREGRRDDGRRRLQPAHGGERLRTRALPALHDEGHELLRRVADDSVEGAGHLQDHAETRARARERRAVRRRAARMRPGAARVRGRERRRGTPLGDRRVRRGPSRRHARLRTVSGRGPAALSRRAAGIGDSRLSRACVARSGHAHYGHAVRGRRRQSAARGRHLFRRWLADGDGGNGGGEPECVRHRGRMVQGLLVKGILAEPSRKGRCRTGGGGQEGEALANQGGRRVPHLAFEHVQRHIPRL